MINITNLTTNQEVSGFFEKIKKIGEIILKEEKHEGEVSVVLVGQGMMRKLNKKYRGKNSVTDVLSFEGVEMEQEKELGEIVICLREVNKNAKRLKSSLEKELATVFIHGLLHLLGHDHEQSDQQAQEMVKKQNYYLETWQNLI